MDEDMKAMVSAIAMMSAVASIAALKDPVSALAAIHKENLLDGLPGNHGESKETAAIKAIAAAAFVLAEVVDEQRAALGLTDKPVTQ